MLRFRRSGGEGRSLFDLRFRRSGFVGDEGRSLFGVGGIGDRVYGW